MEPNSLINNIKCDQCGMIFASSESLRVHKEKFCIGPPNNDDDDGIDKYISKSPAINSKYIQNQKRNDNNYTPTLSMHTSSPIKNSSSTRRFGTPNDEIYYTSSQYNLNPYKTQSAIKELKSFKNKKSMEQSLKDMEDTLVRDTIRDIKLASSINSTSSPTLSSKSKNKTPVMTLENSDPYKGLLKEVGFWIFFLASLYFWEGIRFDDFSSTGQV